MDGEYRLRAKQIERNVLEAELEEEELWECEEYQRLNHQIEELRKQLDTVSQ